MVQIATTFFLFLCGHAIADYALQTEWMATNKNRHIRKKFSKEQQKNLQIIWPYLLTSHSLIHGFAVYMISQNIFLGLAETIVHWIIDFSKCEGWFGFHADQGLHVLCKVIWTYVMYSAVI